MWTEHANARKQKSWNGMLGTREREREREWERGGAGGEFKGKLRFLLICQTSAPKLVFSLMRPWYLNAFNKNAYIQRG